MSSAGGPPSINVRHHSASNRFEAEVEDRTAVLEYQRENERIVFTHTYVPPELRGRAIAGALVRAGLAFARREGVQVVPVCSYVAAYIKRHPEYEDLLAAG